MAAEMLLRSLANGAVILAIVWVFRRRGHRAAGLLAALPVLCAPALFTLGVDHDPAVATATATATATAVAGLHATGLTAALVLCYGVARRPLGAPMALLFGALCALLVASLSAPIGHALGPSLGLTLLLVGMARHYLPRLSASASTPLSAHGPVCRFLRGYLDGLLVRTGFFAVLATGLVPLGGWLAFPLAMGVAVGLLLAVTAWRQRGGVGAGVGAGAGVDVAVGVPCDTEGGSATTRAERS